MMRYIRDNYVDADKAQPKALYEGAMKGMFEALGDPNSAYHNATEWRRISDTTTGTFGGVGLVISKVDKVGAQVESAIEGTPAYKAGVSAGDIIIKVNGDPVADLSIEASWTSCAERRRPTSPSPSNAGTRWSSTPPSPGTSSKCPR